MANTTTKSSGVGFAVAVIIGFAVLSGNCEAPKDLTPVPNSPTTPGGVYDLPKEK